MKSIKYLFFSLLILNLVACGEDEVKDVWSVPPQTKSLDRLEGEWVSGCVESEYGVYYGHRIVRMKFSKNNFESHTEIYYTDDCSGSPDRTTSYVGTYNVQKNIDAQTVLLEYSVPVDAQVWQLFYQKLQFEDSQMIVSEMISGFENENSYTLKVVMTPKD